MKRTLYSGVGLLLVGLLFLAFNLLSSLLLRDQQFDLTQQKLYTFSAGTQEVLDSLDEPLNLYLFFSKSRASDLPALRNYARRVEEVLDLYARRSHGNVRLFVIDPLPFSDDEDRAARFGLQAPPIGPNGEAIYFGLAATNPTDGLQVIPFFSPEEEPLLEYDLSRLVQALAQRERTSRPDELAADDRAGAHRRAAGQQALGDNGQALPTVRHPHPGARFDGNPRRSLGVDAGAPQAIVRTDPIRHRPVRPARRQAAGLRRPSESRRCRRRKSSDLAPLLRSWGVQLRPDTLLADASFAMIKPNAERRPERNPTWLHLPGDTFPHDNVLTTGLESLNLASVGLLEPLGGASTRFIPLLHSSAHSMPLSLERFRQSSTEQLNATLVPTGERYVLAAKVEGPATSAFPADRGKQGEGLSDSANIHVLLVADTDLLSNPLWLQEQPGHNEPQVWADNDLFVGNALDYLSGSDALIDLRSRGHTKRPFTRVEALRREAGLRAQEQLNALQQSLNDTDRNLRTLQQSMDAGDQEVTPEMEATLRRFIDDKLRIRQQLRQLQFQLNADVERLGNR